MVEQIASMNNNQAEQQAKLLELNSDIANSQSEIEKVLKERHYAPLRSEDIRVLNQQNELLTSLTKETNSKIDSLSEKMCSLAVLVESQSLSVSQMRRRTDTLRGLLLSPEDITNRGLNPFAKGSFGQIYSGSFKTAHNKIAFKVIQNKDMSPLTPRQVLSAEGEVLLLDGLKYVSIVACYGYLFDPKKFTIVMELAPFGSLWDLLDDFVTVPSIPFTLCVTWMTTLADALVHIHSKGVVHKDVKCENLLVFHGLAVKLCDFGLAKHDTVGAQSSVTGAGTDRFVAPEVRAKHHATFAADVYSFAMTALQMLKRAAPEIEEVLPRERPSSIEIAGSMMRTASSLLQESVEHDEILVERISMFNISDKIVAQGTNSPLASVSDSNKGIVAELVSWMRQNVPDIGEEDIAKYGQLMFEHKIRSIAERVTTEAPETVRTESERLANEQKAQDAVRIESERLANEKKEQDAARIECERLAKEKRDQEAVRIACERLANEKKAQEAARIESERLSNEKKAQEAVRIESERLANEKKAQEAARIESERLSKEKKAQEFARIECE
eukprot:gene38426-47445_t